MRSNCLAACGRRQLCLRYVTVRPGGKVGWQVANTLFRQIDCFRQSPCNGVVPPDGPLESKASGMTLKDGLNSY
jgi:hypothetical protein